jgi:hypothetical protein
MNKVLNNKNIKEFNYLQFLSVTHYIPTHRNEINNKISPPLPTECNASP